MGLASIKSRVQRIERALRAPVSAANSAARTKMLSLLTRLANDDWAWSEWIALSGGGAGGGATGCADDVARFVPLAQRVNALLAGGGSPER